MVGVSRRALSRSCYHKEGPKADCSLYSVCPNTFFYLWDT